MPNAQSQHAKTLRAQAEIGRFLIREMEKPADLPEPFRLRVAAFIRNAYGDEGLTLPFSILEAVQGPFCPECGRRHLTNACR